LWRKSQEVNAEKAKYVVMSGDQNAGRSHSIKTDNSSLESVEQFRFLGTTVADQNSIQEEIKCSWSQGMLAVIRCRIFFFFHFAIQKYKDEDTQNCNFACCFVWV
jgi:hypothetical protein